MNTVKIRHKRSKRGGFGWVAVLLMVALLARAASREVYSSSGSALQDFSLAAGEQLLGAPETSVWLRERPVVQAERELLCFARNTDEDGICWVEDGSVIYNADVVYERTDLKGVVLKGTQI